MQNLRSIRRLVLGAAIAGAAVGAVPALASAASSCSFDLGTGRATIIDGSGAGQLRLVLSNQFIEFADGAGVPQACDGPLAFATTTTTDRVIIQGSSTSIFDGYVIDQSQGAFGPGATLETDGKSEIEVQVRQSNGAPTELSVVGTSGPDTIRIAGSNAIAIGTDPDIDANIFNPNAGGYRASRIGASGLGGNDFLSGRGVDGFIGGPASVPVDLSGGANDDTVVDGLASDDHIGGDGGNDKLFSVDGRADSLSGGSGFDTATVDNRLDAFNSDLEAPTAGTVGRVRLAPIVVRAEPGKTARLTMSWTHPRSWRALRTLKVRLYDGAKPVGMINVRPRGERPTGHGIVKLMARGSKVSHHGKTVTAKLAVRLPRSLAERSLRVAVQATDRHGHEQLEPDAGTIRVGK
jgi:hypothetical protein